MAKPRSMLQGTLNPKKGWPDTATLDMSAPFSDAALTALDPVPAGRCGRLSADGAGGVQFELGCAAESNKVHMPIFFFHWSDHPDVVNEGGITGSADDDPDGWMSTHRNNMMGIVATAGVELETTEYDKDDTYTPGSPLQAATADEGLLSLGTLGTHHIVGTVSRGEGRLTQLATSQETLSFWPLVLPVYP